MGGGGEVRVSGTACGVAQGANWESGRDGPEKEEAGVWTQVKGVMIDGEASEKCLENVSGITVRAAMPDGTLTTL